VNGRALTAEQATSVRLSNLSDEHWAEAFGVNRSTVMRARIGRTHKDLATPPHSPDRRPRFDTGSKRDGQPAVVDLQAISLPGEEWRPVVRWERFYRVSNLGRLYSLHQTGRLAIGMRVQGGYRVLKLRDGERRAHGVLHRMVLEAFVGPAPSPDHEGCHNDGNPENCREDNLRWDTRQGNQADRILHGTKFVELVRLTADQVREIRSKPDVTLEQWASKLGCAFATVSAARSGRTWKHVDVPPVRKRAPRTIAEQLAQPALLTDRIQPVRRPTLRLQR